MLTWQLTGWRTKVLQWVAWLVKCPCHSGGLVILDPSAYRGFYMRGRALGRDWWTGMTCATVTFSTVSLGCCCFFTLFQDQIFCNASPQLRWLSWQIVFNVHVMICRFGVAVHLWPIVEQCHGSTNYILKLISSISQMSWVPFWRLCYRKCAKIRNWYRRYLWLPSSTIQG